MKQNMEYEDRLSTTEHGTRDQHQHELDTDVPAHASLYIREPSRRGFIFVVH
jgi:hypothetical protein